MERADSNSDSKFIRDYKAPQETNNKMGGRCLEEHVTDPRNKRMEETNRRQRRMEASSETGQCPEGAVAP